MSYNYNPLAITSKMYLFRWQITFVGSAIMWPQECAQMRQVLESSWEISYPYENWQCMITGYTGTGLALITFEIGGIWQNPHPVLNAIFGQWDGCFCRGMEVCMSWFNWKY